jgi:hypothetical protein
MPQIKITMRKDGRQVARFRDNQGLVRTSTGPVNWTRADQIKELADYGIALQVAQARAGLGSDGQKMAPLNGGGGRAVFVASVNGKAQFTRKTYGDWKSAHGLQPVRDLYGRGEGGHMVDDIRVNYLDDKQATIAITTKVSRDKARGNERRSPWWGWTPDSVRKMTAAAAEIFQTGVAEHLFAMGLIGANALSQAKRLWKKGG